MKKLLNQIICGAVTAALAAVTFTGCGKEEADSGGDGGGNSFTYWMELPTAASAVVTNYGETAFAKEWQKRCGVTIDFQHPPQGQGAEKFNIMMASKNLPDIIEYNWTKYPGGPAKAIKDGKIIKLNEYIEKYAPELLSYLDEHEEVAKLCKTDEGDIFAFPFIRGDDALSVSQGLMVRKDWLDELNIEEPETIDEWEAMLTAFKEKKGAEAPLDMAAYAFQQGAFSGAYGIEANFYVDDGKVKFGPYEPEFKDFLMKMNDWYGKGLITQDIATIANNVIDSDLLTGKAGAVYGALGGGMGKWLAAKPDDKFDLVGVKYPVLNKGDKPKFNSIQLLCPTDFIAVTASCKNPEKAAEFLSYGYTEEGHMFFNFGIEGESYEMKDGYPTYTENITNNSEGFAMANMLAQYCQSYWAGPFIQDRRYYEQYAGLPQQQYAWENFSYCDGVNRTVPYLYFSEAESSELSKKESAIFTYVDEQVCKYIISQQSFDDYDEFTAQLEKLGIKEVLAAKQEAYDKYLTR